MVNVDKPLHWSKERKQAAWLLGRTTLRAREIAENVGVSVETLYSWRAHPEFKDAVRKHEEEELEEARRVRYARRSDRILALSHELQQIDEVFTARASDVAPYEADKHGLETGRVVRQYKGFGNGEFLEIKTEYAIDTPAIKEKRELLKQLAQEVGEWNDKPDPNAVTESQITIQFTEREDGAK